MRENSLDNFFLSPSPSPPLSFSITHSHSRSLSPSSFSRHFHATGRTYISSISRKATNLPRDDHVLARPRPNFDLKFLRDFIQKYMYTYVVGVYVTLRPYNIRSWIQAEFAPTSRLNKPDRHMNRSIPSRKQYL